MRAVYCEHARTYRQEASRQVSRTQFPPKVKGKAISSPSIENGFRLIAFDIARAISFNVIG